MYPFRSEEGRFLINIWSDFRYASDIPNLTGHSCPALGRGISTQNLTLAFKNVRPSPSDPIQFRDERMIEQQFRKTLIK